MLEDGGGESGGGRLTRTLLGAKPAAVFVEWLEAYLRHLGRLLTTIAGIQAMVWFTRSLDFVVSISVVRAFSAILRAPCSLYAVRGSVEHDWRPLSDKRQTEPP